jgi:hypothetical protein
MLTCGTLEPPATSISKAAYDRKKKASDQKSGGKKNLRKETLLYIEDDMRVP